MDNSDIIAALEESEVDDEGEERHSHSSFNEIGFMPVSSGSDVRLASSSSQDDEKEVDRIIAEFHGSPQFMVLNGDAVESDETDRADDVELLKRQVTLWKRNERKDSRSNSKERNDIGTAEMGGSTESRQGSRGELVITVTNAPRQDTGQPRMVRNNASASKSAWTALSKERDDTMHNFEKRTAQSEVVVEQTQAMSDYYGPVGMDIVDSDPDSHEPEVMEPLVVEDETVKSAKEQKKSSIDVPRSDDDTERLRAVLLQQVMKKKEQGDMPSSNLEEGELSDASSPSPPDESPQDILLLTESQDNVSASKPDETVQSTKAIARKRRLSTPSSEPKASRSKRSLRERSSSNSSDEDTVLSDSSSSPTRNPTRKRKGTGHRDIERLLQQQTSRGVGEWEKLIEEQADAKRILERKVRCCKSQKRTFSSKKNRLLDRAMECTRRISVLETELVYLKDDAERFDGRMSVLERERDKAKRDEAKRIEEKRNEAKRAVEQQQQKAPKRAALKEPRRKLVNHDASPVTSSRTIGGNGETPSGVGTRGAAEAFAVAGHSSGTSGKSAGASTGSECAQLAGAWGGQRKSLERDRGVARTMQRTAQSVNKGVKEQQQKPLSMAAAKSGEIWRSRLERSGEQSSRASGSAEKVKDSSVKVAVEGISEAATQMVRPGSRKAWATGKTSWPSTTHVIPKPAQSAIQSVPNAQHVDSPETTRATDSDQHQVGVHGEYLQGPTYFHLDRKFYEEEPEEQRDLELEEVDDMDEQESPVDVSENTEEELHSSFDGDLDNSCLLDSMDRETSGEDTEQMLENTEYLLVLPSKKKQHDISSQKKTDQQRTRFTESMGEQAGRLTSLQGGEGEVVVGTEGLPRLREESYAAPQGKDIIETGTGNELRAAIVAGQVTNLGNPMKSREPNHALPQKLIKRRKRLTTAQRAALDALYETNPKPYRESMAHKAEELELDFNVVRNWFYNRRKKSKQTAEALQACH